MNIDKLKKEINEEAYFGDPRSMLKVIDVDILMNIIDELQAKNNEVLDLVSNCCPKCKTINITENEGVIWCYECEKAYDC
tara:strand:+ start:103 stop:342 length:240 start_codon:yes stop_codon:yes gene_type:complete